MPKTFTHDYSGGRVRLGLAGRDNVILAIEGGVQMEPMMFGWVDNDAFQEWASGVAAFAAARALEVASDE